MPLWFLSPLCAEQGLIEIFWLWKTIFAGLVAGWKLVLAGLVAVFVGIGKLFGKKSST